MGGIGMIIAGVYMTLVGLGKVAVSKNAEKNAEWLTQYGKYFKIGGPVTIVCGAITMFAK